MLKFIAVCLLLACTTLQADQLPLRFAINDSWGMPMVRIEHDTAVEGILVDLQRALAAKVGREAKLIVLPHMRVERAMDAGDIDVRCYVSPSWVNAGHQRFIWTRPFMNQRDLLVSTKPGSFNVEDLQRERIGTVLGFNYPRLQPLFERGQLFREDTRTQDQALLKLRASRYHYAITNEHSLAWFNRQQAPEKRLYAHSVLTSVPVSCIVRNEPDVPVLELLHAMEQMAEEGRFDQIISEYR